MSIIRHGRTAETGSLTELRHLTRTSVTAELASAPAGLAGLPGVHDLQVEARQDGARVACEIDNEHLDGILRRLTENGVRSLVSQPPTLEQLFLRHYSDDLAANGNSVPTTAGGSR